VFHNLVLRLTDDARTRRYPAGHGRIAPDSAYSAEFKDVDEAAIVELGRIVTIANIAIIKNVEMICFIIPPFVLKGISLRPIESNDRAKKPEIKCLHHLAYQDVLLHTK
jgi:hypothetical protein